MIRGFIAALSLAVPASAGEFSLITPIQCDLKNDCYIQQFVDHGPGSTVRDFNCGRLSYDGHKGTDFALPTLARMVQGMAVIASASGTVRGVRDGMPDTGFTETTAEDIEGRECGNGVVISHEAGWETQYCHLLNGSVAVKTGQSVTAGDFLGLVGMSGRAEFPHVHLSVRKNGQVIDPFDPQGRITCTAPVTDSLWAEPPPFRAAGIITLGISADMPDYKTVKAGTSPLPNISSPALVIFANIFGTRAGDRLDLSLSGPSGTIISQNIEMTRDQASSFRGIGRKSGGDAWQAGVYEGTATLRRNGNIVEKRSVQTDLE